MKSHIPRRVIRQLLTGATGEPGAQYMEHTTVTDSDIDHLTTQAIPVACRTRTSPGNTTFTNITLGRAHYRDVTANCRCQDVRLIRTGFYLYSDCKQHGMVALDQLVRETGANGRPA